MFRQTLVSTQFNISQHLQSVPAMECQHRLRADWEKARGYVQAEMELKVAHWGLLPHILCGLGHHDTSTVIQVAGRCLQLWEESGTATHHHQMTKRFLDPSWNGTPAKAEKPLRPIVPWMKICTALF